MDKEKLILDIMKDLDCTREEAEEVAEIELKASKIRHNVRAAVEKKKTERPRKVDEEKAKILDYVKKGLTLLIDSTTIQLENETKLHFNYNGNEYSVMLTKHRPKK